MRSTRSVSWLASGLMALALTAAPAWAQDIVHVAQGDLAGTTDHSARAWLGIPFAAPPVGDLRWRPPATPAAWTGVRTADHFSPSCEQDINPNGFGPWTAEYVASGAISEDCLYLNVWAPAKAAKKLPVLVWIYGGGFGSGSASVPIYNGASLADHGIIVVSLNYRVGLYGFFSHPDLDTENAAHASGNYGLMDQVAALRWIRANIAAFGGDPDNVTIAGQSAGAASVHALIDSPMAGGLFQRAIAESGSGMGIVIPDHATADATGVSIAQAAGATTIAQLRALTPEQLHAAAQGRSYGPVVDGAFFPDAATANDGNANDVPVLTGLTADENSSSATAGQPVTPDALHQAIARSFGGDADAISALYPATDDASAKVARQALARDRGLAALYQWAANREAKSHAPVYAYLWTHVEPGPDAARYGAFHTSEVPYVFGTLGTSPRPFTAEDYALSKEAQAYWLNFIKSGDPNGPNLVAWPRLTTPGKQILDIGDTTKARPVLDPARFDAFSAYIANGGKVALFGF